MRRDTGRPQAFAGSVSGPHSPDTDMYLCVARMRLACVIEKRFPGVARERSVWTVGRVELDPGAPSIIPGGATMLFQFRDDELGQLERFKVTLRELVDELNRIDPAVARSRSSTGLSRR
jgi:hypothetical protein